MQATQKEIERSIAQTYNTKPRPRQRLAVAKLKENRGNLSKSMREAGYSEVTAKNPRNLTESKGFLQSLNEAGLTDDYLNACLSEDIESKKGNRLGEVTLAYKLRGKLHDTNAVQVNVISGIEYQAPQPREDESI